MKNLIHCLFAILVFVFVACTSEKADPEFYIAGNSFELDSSCEQFEIDVTHNVDFTVTTDVDWISEMEGSNSGKVSFAVERNATNDFRKGKITFVCEEAGVKAVVDVKQNGRYEIVYTTKHGERLDYDYYGTDYSRFFDARLVSHTYKSGKGVFEFDSEVTRIEEIAFFNHSYITSIDLPNTIRYIGNSAFYGTSIEAIDIHNAEIGDYVFAYCRQLKKMVIPGIMTSVPVGTFEECRSLQNVSLPYGIKEIGGLAFWGCTELKSIQLPQSVRKIGNAAFRSCYSLEEIEMPTYLETLGASAFYSTDIKNFVVPKGIKTIETETFYHCSKLQSLELPSTLTLIKDNFFLCWELVTIKCSADVPPVFTEGFADYGVDLSKLKIYVPSASVQAYRTSEYWAQYAGNIFPIE